MLQREHEDLLARILAFLPKDHRGPVDVDTFLKAYYRADALRTFDKDTTPEG